MKSSASKIQLAGFDDLFQTSSEAEANGEQVREVPLTELFPFKDHPFQVRDDEAMQKTVASIARSGVLSPGIVRPRPGGGYEIIANHIVAVTDAVQIVPQDRLPAHGIYQRDLQARQLDVSGEKVNALRMMNNALVGGLRLINTYGSKLRIFDSIIPLSIRAAETSAEGRSIYLHDPAGKVSAAYTALTQEVLS